MTNLKNIVTYNDCVFDAPRSGSGLEEKDKATNQLAPSFAEFAISKGFLPVGAQIFIPLESEVEVDWISPGWFAIYEVAFRMGFKLPCSKIVQDVVSTFGIYLYFYFFKIRKH